jgi:sporulation protein YlmC with PRC-barrel domain
MHNNFCIAPFRQTLFVSEFISVYYNYVRRVNQYCLILKIPC